MDDVIALRPSGDDSNHSLSVDDYTPAPDGNDEPDATSESANDTDEQDYESVSGSSDHAANTTDQDDEVCWFL